MSFEKSFLQNQVIESQGKKDNAKKNNKEAVDLKRRGFFKAMSGAAATIVVGVPVFKAVEHVLDLSEEDEKLEVGSKKDEDVEVLISEKQVPQKADLKQSDVQKDIGKESEVKEGIDQKQNKEEENQKSKEKIKMFFENIVEAHGQIKNSNQLWYKEVLPESVLTAQEIVESGLDGSRVSPRGAIGICQLTPISIKAVFEYLSILRSKDVVKINNFHIPNDEEVIEILQIAQSDDDFCRMLRDIYMSYLGPNGIHGPNIGEVEYKKNKNKLFRQYLLAAYNMGEGKFKRIWDWSKWPKETKNYTWKIEVYNTKIKELEKELVAQGKDFDDYEDLGRMVMEREV